MQRLGRRGRVLQNPSAAFAAVGKRRKTVSSDVHAPAMFVASVALVKPRLRHFLAWTEHIALAVAMVINPSLPDA